MYHWLWETSLYQKWLISFILICNIFGTIYGYHWYSSQLANTPNYFKLFVPDSPTATLFLCLSLLFILFNKRNALIDALAFITLFKYGSWAVIMNILMFIKMNDIAINGLMLLISHAIMILEAIYFYPRFKISKLAGLMSFIWVTINDVIDYIYGQYPYYDFIAKHLIEVGVLAYSLTIISYILFLKLQKWLKFKTFD